MGAVAILRDRFALALIAGTVVVIVVLALSWPVRLSDYDPWGFQIACGTGFTSSYDQATLADQRRVASSQPSGDYVSACRSAVLWRRAWAVAALGIGGGGLAALLLERQRPRVDGAEAGNG